MNCILKIRTFLKFSIKSSLIVIALLLSQESFSQSKGVGVVNSSGLIQISGSVADIYEMSISHLGLSNYSNASSFFSKYLNSDFIRLDFDFKSGIAFMQIEHNKVIDSKPTVVSLNKLLTTIKTYGK